MEQPAKAPEESKVLAQSANSSNIKAKMEELRGKMEQVKADREQVEQEIREVQAKPLASGGSEDYSWQQGEPVKGYGLPVVIVVAMLSFIVGRFIMNV